MMIKVSAGTRRMEERRFARRSLLYVPGDSWRKLEKATTLAADTVILDLEDAVAGGRKEEARGTVRRALHELDFGGRERLVRINPIGSALAFAELEATLPLQPDGYIVPKVEIAEDLRAVDRAITEHELVEGKAQGTIRLFAMVETARGVLNLREIVAASARLDGLILGAEDLAADVGAIRTQAGWEIFYARSILVMAAAAYGLHPIDGVYTGIQDLDGLQDECARVRELGFTGKTAIHPGQLPIINQAFLPSAEEIDRAQQIVAGFEQHTASGSGVFVFDGQMVDMPVVRSARRILARAGV